MKHALNHVARPLAAHHGVDDRIGRRGGFLKRQRGFFKVHGDGGRQHLDMADFLGRGMQKHVAILGGRAARSPGLEKILQADTDFPFDPADGLL